MKAKGEDTTEVMASVEGLKGRLQTIESSLKDIQSEFDSILAVIPNAPHPSAPVGAGEEENVEVSLVWGLGFGCPWALEMRKDLEVNFRDVTADPALNS